MALEALSDSKYQFAFSSRVLNQVTGDTMQPSSSNNLVQNDGQYQAVVASLLNASSGNLSGSSAKIAQMNEGMVSGLRNQPIVHETTNYRLSRFSSLLPESNSAFSTGPLSHRSASANVYSYLNLPPLPVFSSHSLSSTGSSNTDGSSIMQQTSSHLGVNSSQLRKRKQQQRGLTASSPPDLQRRQSSPLNGIKQNLCASNEAHKKPRSNILQHRSKSEQQNVMQSNLQLGRVDIDKQQQMRQSQLQQAVHPVPTAYALHSGVCSRRITQYMYHLRHRPSDNDITYWRKFVAEYFAPCAKKRWCLSMYDNVGHHAFGFLPKAAMDAWQCDLCGCKSGRGLEANLEALPRLNKIMFESGVIDELLYLELPHERVQFSGLMILEYGKAVQETVYDQCRVVREGKLRIVFTPDLKILSWEFCAWQHEEFLPQNLVASQVNQLVQTAQNYESTINFSGSDGATPHDLQANCNMFLVAGCQLARNLELDSVDNLGFPKRYVRALQIAEIVNSMRDLITFSLNNNTGPIESLRNYSRGTSTSKPLKDESPEMRSAQCPLNDGRKLMAASPVLDNSENYSSSFSVCGPLASSEEAMLSPGYYDRLLRHNLFNPEMSKVKQEPSSSYKSGALSKSFEGPKTSQSGLVQNSSADGMSSFDTSECNQKKTEERLIRRLLQEMINNSRTNGGSEVEKVNYKTTSNKNSGFPATPIVSDLDRNKVEFRNNISSPFGSGNAASGNGGKFSSFSAASSALPYGIYDNDNFIRRDQYLPEVIQSMAHGYCDYRISDCDGGSGGDMIYHGKA